MNRRTFISGLFVPSLLKAQTVEDSILIVNITGIKKRSGCLLIGVFDSAADMEASKFSGGDKRSIAWKVVKVKRSVASVCFIGIPNGVYSVGVIHDANNNKRLDTAFGKPIESFGISRNPYVKYKYPKWTEVSFKKTGETKVNIILKQI